MTDQFARTQLTFGKENMEKLYKARVIVFGIGAILMTIKGCFSDINKKIDLEQKNNTSNKTEN